MVKAKLTNDDLKKIKTDYENGIGLSDQYKKYGYSSRRSFQNALWNKGVKIKTTMILPDDEEKKAILCISTLNHELVHGKNFDGERTSDMFIIIKNEYIFYVKMVDGVWTIEESKIDQINNKTTLLEAVEDK